MSFPLSISEFDAIESALNCWIVAEYIATFVVLVGVAGEYVADFTEWPGTPERKKRWGKLATLVLIVGLAAELVTLVRVTQLSGRETGLLKIAAESLRNDNLALEKAVQPRRAFMVPGAKRAELMPLLAEFDAASGTPAFIQVVPDFEAQILANDIAMVLSGHKWHVKFVTQSETHVSPMVAGAFGVEIWTWKPENRTPPPKTAEDRGWMAGETLKKFLALSDLDSPHFEQDSAAPMVDDTPLAFRPPPNAVVVYIGMKPVWTMLPPSK